MKNIFKFLKGHIKQFNHKHKYWWIICIYLFVPTILILIFDKVFTPILNNYMMCVKIGGGAILNSEYARYNVINPFVKSMSIIAGVTVSYIILCLLQRKILKSKIYFEGINKCIKFIEAFSVLLAIIIAVYGKESGFDHSQYGYSAATLKEVIVQENTSYISLEEIPSIHSIGIEVKQEKPLYNMLLHMSQFGFYLSDNLEMIIAIVGAVIIPLKNYSEKIEKCTQYKDSNKKHKEQ